MSSAYFLGVSFKFGQRFIRYSVNRQAEWTLTVKAKVLGKDLTQ